MFRMSAGYILRRTACTTICVRNSTIITRRTIFASTIKPRKRSLRLFAAKWVLVVAGIYYYMTSDIFAGEPASYFKEHPKPTSEIVDDGPDRHTILDEVAKRQRISEKSSVTSGANNDSDASDIPRPEPPKHDTESGQKTLEELGEEAGQQDAYNEETGEINWDCPCLGGMAHGPCGEEFKTAFSCFIYSTAEPKGVDCIDRFKTMQECFRRYPDVYANEIGDDEEEEANAESQNNPKDQDQDQNQPQNGLQKPELASTTQLTVDSSDPQSAVGSQNQTAGSQNQTTGSQNQITSSQNQTAGSQNQTTSSQNQTAGSQDQTTGSPSVTQTATNAKDVPASKTQNDLSDHNRPS